MAKVSIIIPVYNVEKYLEECMNSVLRQTLRDIEVICVNDGSTDRSGDILGDYMEKDDRVVLVVQENGGYGKAMNTGLQRASGEYVGIVGASGSGKSTLLKLLMGFEKPQVGRIYYDGQDIDELDKRELRKK